METQGSGEREERNACTSLKPTEPAKAEAQVMMPSRLSGFTNE
jgi:hypothetical protein